MKKFLSIVVVFASLTLLSSCAEDGENGLGFDEAAKYGNIKVTLTGKRPDTGADFTKTIDFKFAPVEPGDIGSSSAVYPSENENYFELLRFYGTVDDVYQENYINIEFTATNNASILDYLELDTFVETKDYKYFQLYVETSDGFTIPNSAFSNYSYTPSKGSLKFNMNFDVPANYNNTGYPLNVKVAANVKVLEEVYSPGE